MDFAVKRLSNIYIIFNIHKLFMKHSRNERQKLWFFPRVWYVEFLSFLFPCTVFFSKVLTI